MKLIKLILDNFKGIRHLELTPNGKSISVFGDNGTGKTTIADAQFWLLFGKDSADTKNFMPKTKANGEDVHNIENSVEGTYQMEDGSVLTLKKTFSELWKKKRGSSSAMFSGHTKEHFLDGVPVKESEYMDRLSEIADMEKLLVLSSDSYFSESLSAADRRRILLDVVGDISDADVISSNHELKELNTILQKPNAPDQKYTAEEYHKIAKARLSEINKQLQLLPARLDEAQKAIPEEVDSAAIDDEIKSLTTERYKLLNQLHSSRSEKESALQTELSEIQVSLLDAEAAHKKKYMELNRETEQQLKSARGKQQVAQVTKQRSDTEKIRLEFQLGEMKRARDALLEEYNREGQSQWSGNTICPTCGQAIPEEQIAESMEQFQLQKSRKLEELRRKGKETCSQEMIDALQKDLEKKKTISEQETKKISEFQLEIDYLESSLTVVPLFSETDEYKELLAKRGSISEQLEEVRKNGKAMQTALQIQLDEINAKIKAAMEKQAVSAQAEQQKARVSELEQAQKRFGKEYEQCSRGIYLCESFIRAKVSMLTDRINSKFQNVQFRLFETQINGGVKETCETLVPSENGVMPYSYVNHAARVNAGLDIVRVLSAHYGVTMPVFIDNAESVTELNTDGLQIIRLVVSENDKTLRVEE